MKSGISVPLSCQERMVEKSLWNHLERTREGSIEIL
jgi:hypothetical protein